MPVRSAGFYQITVYQDGSKSSDHYYENAIEAVGAWFKFVDSGDAKEVRTIIFNPPIGDTATKSFYAE